MLDRISSNPFSSPQKLNTSVEETKVVQKEIRPQEIAKELKHIEENPLDKERIEEIVQSMNKFLQPTHTSLKFEFHEKLNEYYVKIVDDKTKETVREIPSKKLLDMYAAMTDFLGLIVDKKI